MARNYTRKKSVSDTLAKDPLTSTLYADIYTDAIVNSIATKMNIKSEKNINLLKKNLIGAARYYEVSKQSAKHYKPKNEEDAALKKVSTTCDDLKNKLIELREKGLSIHRTHQAFFEIRDKDIFRESSIRIFDSFISSGAIKPIILIEFIEDLYKLLKHAETIEPANIASSRIRCIYQFIKNIDYFWNKNEESKPLSSVRWDIKDESYRSESLSIIKEMIVPIDQTITDSEVTNAVRLVISELKRTSCM